MPDEDGRLSVQRLICDFDAKTAEHAAINGEAVAKSLKGVRNYASLPAYEWINRFEPTNTETLFDYGQVLGNLKMNRASCRPTARCCRSIRCTARRWSPPTARRPSWPRS